MSCWGAVGGKRWNGWLIPSNGVDIGSGAWPRTWSGWQSRNLLNVVAGTRKPCFYRLSQVIRRKPGFVETNQAQDSTSRKLLCAFRFIFSLQIKNLAPRVCYKVLLGQRDLEKQQQQPTGFPWHLGKKALSSVCLFFSYPLRNTPLEAEVP